MFLILRGNLIINNIDFSFNFVWTKNILNFQYYKICGDVYTFTPDIGILTFLFISG